MKNLEFNEAMGQNRIVRDHGKKSAIRRCHFRVKNRLRAGNASFIEHPVRFGQKIRRQREIPYMYAIESMFSLSHFATSAIRGRQ